MTDMLAGPSVEFTSDETLAYAGARRRFGAGERLLFDAPYRYAHLPLVAPRHAAVIAAPDGLDYRAGRYETERYAVVIPVPQVRLADSPVFHAIDGTLRRASFAAKIAFDLCATRWPVQHITIASGLAPDDLARIESAIRDRLQGPASAACRLKGPFIGAKNFGRMYFPAYPVVRTGDDAYALLQNAVGVRRTGFYAMGYYNFVDELDGAETAELAGIVDAFADRIVLEAEPDEVWIMATHDDLALSARVVTRIATRQGD
jgi:hypothetical protein